MSRKVHPIDPLSDSYAALRDARDQQARVTAMVTKAEEAYRAMGEVRLLEVARDHGLFDLPPPQFEAAIKSMLANAPKVVVRVEPNSKSAAATSTIHVEVTAGRNVTTDKRPLIDMLGLEWDGLKGKWAGPCGDTHLNALRKIFGKAKVEVVLADNNLRGVKPASNADAPSAPPLPASSTPRIESADETLGEGGADEPTRIRDSEAVENPAQMPNEVVEDHPNEAPSEMDIDPDAANPLSDDTQVVRVAIPRPRRAGSPRSLEDTERT
jgi:hypothetical protein